MDAATPPDDPASDGPATNTYAFRIGDLDRRRMEMVLALSGMTKTELFREGLREACRRRLMEFAEARDPREVA